MGDGVVRRDAFPPVDVVGRDAGVEGDLEEVLGIGAVPAPDDEDEVEVQLILLGDELRRAKRQIRETAS